MNEAVKDGRLHHMDAGDIAQMSRLFGLGIAAATMGKKEYAVV